MTILFMPGVGGAPTFWQPVADRLPATWQKTLLGWPGLGDQPPAADINGWDDLYRFVEQRIDGNVALVAQSMGTTSDFDRVIRQRLEERGQTIVG